ncbi:MAG: hypothetical protein LC777_07490 [Actinobacteria bacterium]|nr:hypothetical protein [Actinomycetota bacterium]
MTRAEAVNRCAELQAGAGDRDVRWIARQISDRDWAVVRVRAAGLPPKIAVLGTAQQSPPRPQAPDPRPLTDPYWGAG